MFEAVCSGSLKRSLFNVKNHTEDKNTLRRQNVTFNSVICGPEFLTYFEDVECCVSIAFRRVIDKILALLEYYAS